MNGALVAMNKFDELNQLWKDVGENIEVIYTSDFINTNNQQNKVTFNLDVKSLRQKLLPELNIKVNLWKGLGLLFSKTKRDEFIDSVLRKVGEEVTENLSSFRALADNTPLHNLLNEKLSLAAIPKETKFLCGYVSLTSGAYHCNLHTEYATDSEFAKGVLASTAMPIVWEPVNNIQLKKQVVKEAVDGGIRNVSPLGDVIALINSDPDNIPYKIFIINCNSGKVELEEKKLNIAQIALRSLYDIAITEIFNNDIEQFILINDLIKQSIDSNKPMDFKKFDYQTWKRTNTTLRYFDYDVISPENSILGDTLTSSPELIRKRIEHGWQKARDRFERKELTSIRH